MSDVVLGMFIEKVRTALDLLAQIMSSSDERVSFATAPNLKELQWASTALQCISHRLREGRAAKPSVANAAAFKTSLAQDLAIMGIRLQSIVFGRGTGGSRFWLLNILDRDDCLRTVEVPIPSHLDSYDNDVGEAIYDALRKHSKDSNYG